MCIHRWNKMWANAQPDGRPAEYRWSPLFNAAVWLTPTPTTTVPCRLGGWSLTSLFNTNTATSETKYRAVMLGCPKFANRSLPLTGQSSPYCGDMWRRYCCVTSFFSDCQYVPYSCEDMVRQSCAMVRRWRIFGDFFASCISSEPRAACFRPASQIRTMATPCVESMVDIKSATAENRRGKKKKIDRRRNHRTQYNGLPYSTGRP